MPIEIKYTQDGIGVEYIVTGVVTGADIIEANNAVYSNESFSRQRYQIVDRTGCIEFQVSNKEMRTVAAQDQEAAKINPNIVVALISTSDLQYGMSRVYQSYSGDSGFLTEIFPDRKSAEAWIEDQLVKF